ncbi:MAG TPA: hypothetical protein VM841_02040 [Actinomycetota bacterium]|nr:hypothetical protein [Actinomycetota bacterium]
MSPIARALIVAGIAVSLVASAMVVADRNAPARRVAAADDDLLASPPEDAAVAATRFAAAIHGVPVRDGDPDDSSRYCSTDRLRVLWTAPGEGYTHGGYIEPLGPEPGPDTVAVNGVVVCEGSAYAYMGFEALRDGDGWQIIPVPAMLDDDSGNDEETPGNTVDPGLTAKASPPAATAAASGKVPTRSTATLTAAIETYAGYDAQDTCSPPAKPGVLAFRKLVLGTYPGTRSLGISRGCGVGGRSEHKEGRAWDWGVNVNRPAERAAADALIGWLLATDEFGNRHAMARRLGIMYIVWNRTIWGSYRSDQGWRAYNGASPHTDHVHFSFAWPGANGATSFWTGAVATMPGGNGGGGSFRDAGGGGSVRGVPRDGERWWRNRTDEGTRTDIQRKRTTRTEPIRWQDRSGRWWEWDRETRRWKRIDDPSATPTPTPEPEPTPTLESDPSPEPESEPKSSGTPAPSPSMSPRPSPSATSGTVRWDGSRTGGDRTGTTEERRRTTREERRIEREAKRRQQREVRRNERKRKRLEQKERQRKRREQRMRTRTTNG